MSHTVEWRIPPSVLHWLARIPANRPAALLLRHSVRDALPPGDAGYSLPITETGIKLARELGELLGPRLRSIHASPLLRCVQTAEALCAGAGAHLPVVSDRLLGDPGVYVLDSRRAALLWESLGHAGIMQRLVESSQALPGMARPDCAARFLVHHMLAAANGTPGVHVFVTHDSLVTATTAWIVEKPLGTDDWPWYLEGALFWRAADTVHAAYREHERHGIPAALCGFGPADLIELARREIAATLGFDSGARFFLAGGAFKTLLTGRAPRDLDLWAPSAEDRSRLVSTLLERGARRSTERPFADAFEIAGRVVEVPHQTEPATLDERLGRFDLALSAIGVEHRPGDHWAARVHPLAPACVERREVRLLKPLVNWKYALATLERMRRYAAELQFIVPPEEEAEVWRVFMGQSADMRAGMLERFKRTALGGWNVEEEAACLCR